MFWALDENSCRIYASTDISSDKKYFCPICKQQVRLRSAKEDNLNSPHFFHVERCADDWNYEPMSEWHISWQNLFPKGNREIVIENPKTKERHRADVGVYGTIIEFQHSPISEHEFWKRNNFYTSIGYKVVWVFDMTELTRDSIWGSTTRLHLEGEWHKEWGGGGKYRWKNPWRFLGGFVPQQEKNIDIFICYGPLSETPKAEDADGCIERVTWVNPDFTPAWGRFHTSYNIINYSELLAWLKNRWEKTNHITPHK